jgi:hypothetical protein
MRSVICEAVATIAFAAAATVAFAGSAPVYAADMPGKSGLRTISQESRDWYVWVDGSAYSVPLPRYDISFVRNIGTPFAVDLGSADSFDPRATGGGATAGFGLRLADPPPWPFLGSNTRIELSGAYIHADARQSSGTRPIVLFSLLQVSGRVFDGPFFCVTCSIASSLDTSYQTGQAHLRLATDHVRGPLTFTPSLGAFYGRGRIAQDGTQVLSRAIVSTYTVSSTLKWTDWGAKLAGDISLAVSPRVTLGLGGGVALAARDVSFGASDVISGYPVVPAASTLTSAASDSATTPATILNGEARMLFRPADHALLKVFAGVTQDNRVPGVASAHFCCFPLQGAPGQQGTPARILFSRETSWYAGAGLTVQLRP